MSSHQKAAPVAIKLSENSGHRGRGLALAAASKQNWSIFLHTTVMQLCGILGRDCFLFCFFHYCLFF